jgi:hypothetical protein
MKRWALFLVAVTGCSRDPLEMAGIDASTPDLAQKVDQPDARSPIDATICVPMELQFQPGAPDLQIVIWIEDANGNFVDTLYLTSLTALRGLGNRPGAALLKTGDRWPFGRREMVLPIWAHRRNHHYRLVMMGGACGNSPQGVCPNGSLCGGDCDDTTIAYHSRVESTPEPYYIDPFSMTPNHPSVKGAYADQSQYSLYPPRGDLTTVAPQDSPDVADFAKADDLAVISQATPEPGAAMAIPWNPTTPVDGDFVVFIEASAESDFNAFHNHPNQPDSVNAWDFEGHAFLGQPSIVYRIPFHAGQPSTATVMDYAGYSTWDGSDGILHGPDQTITTDQPGSGVNRLQILNDSSGTYRMKVTTSSCQ